MHPLLGKRVFDVPDIVKAHLDQPPHNQDNYATYRYGPEASVSPQLHANWFEAITKQMSRFQATWDVLEDDLSRAILVECLVFNSLGWRRYRRSQNSPAYQAFIKQLAAGHPDYPIEVPRVKPIRHKWMNLHHIPSANLRVIATNGFFINVLFNKQYGMQRPGLPACVEPGDVVIDCGAGSGDTTMWLAHLAGTDGRVFGYEFSPGNVQLFRHNLQINPNIAARVVPVLHAAGTSSGVEVRFGDHATGSRIGRGATHSTRTLSIDDLVTREKPQRVDLIKMDIEGSEADALKGAVRTIVAFRPKLAICAYHKFSDLVRLPSLIRQIYPGYRLFLDHHTIHHEETVLYAFPQ